MMAESYNYMKDGVCIRKAVDLLDGINFDDQEEHHSFNMIFLWYGATKASQTTIKNLSLKAMRKFPVPLPPIEEQQRIVERLDALLPLCDELTTE